MDRYPLLWGMFIGFFKIWKYGFLGSLSQTGNGISFRKLLKTKTFTKRILLYLYTSMGKRIANFNCFLKEYISVLTSKVRSLGCRPGNICSNPDEQADCTQYCSNIDCELDLIWYKICSIVQLWLKYCKTNCPNIVQLLYKILFRHWKWPQILTNN